VLVGTHEGVLCRIGRVGVAAKKPKGDVEQRPLMPFDQALEPGRITRQAPANERGVVVLTG